MIVTLAQALAHGHGAERQFTCPVHTDEHPSASVNVAKGKWYCYVCHASGNISGEVWDALTSEDVAQEVSRLLETDEATFYPESWLDTFDAAGPGSYWAERFEPATSAHFRLGYDPIHDAATYPLRRPNGWLIGVVRRDLSGVGQKYRYPARVKTTELLFNYAPNHVSRVVLTEGATDAMACWEAGLSEAADTLALACFSNLISRTQMGLLARIDPDEVVIGFDNDKAGRTGAEQLVGMLGGRYRLLLARIAPYKDLAEMPPELRHQAVEQSIAL